MKKKIKTFLVTKNVHSVHIMGLLDPEVNFGVILIKRYARIEATHKTCSLDAKLFLGIEERPILDQVTLNISYQRKEMRRHTNDTKVCIKD